MKKIISFLVCFAIILTTVLSTAYAVQNPAPDSEIPKPTPGTAIEYFQNPDGGAAAIVVKEWMSGNLYMKLLHTLLVLVVGYLLMFGVVRFTNKRIKDVKARHVVRKNIMYSVTALMILIVVFLWIHKINSLTILIGFASAGIALALQEALLCVAGWFLILFRHPFGVGDRV